MKHIILSVAILVSVISCSRDEKEDSVKEAARVNVGAVAPEASPVTVEQLEELQSEIDAGRQNISNIEAFVQMERAKLEDNPNYEQSFMLEALEEQKGIREKVEAGEKRLKELSK